MVPRTRRQQPAAHHDVEMGAPLPLPLPYAGGFERDREPGKRALGWCFVFGLEAVAVEHFAFEFWSCLRFGWWTVRTRGARVRARSELQGMLTAAVIPA